MIGSNSFAYLTKIPSNLISPWQGQSSEGSVPIRVSKKKKKKKNEDSVSTYGAVANLVVGEGPIYHEVDLLKSYKEIITQNTLS